MSSSPPLPSPATDDGDGVGASDRTAKAAIDPKKAKSRRKLRRRASGAVLLLAGLLTAGGLATALTPSPQVATADAQSPAALIADGKKLYETSCITCHGKNLDGVQSRGPSLVGVGDAAVYFQVSSGRMPAARGEAQAARKPSKFTDAQIDQLGAYVQSVGGGPSVVYEHNADGSVKMENGLPVIAQGQLQGHDIGRGSELFRLNCASCHNFTGRGGALSSGKFAPNLDPANEQQIWTAMLSGPQNMPKFSDRQLTPDEKKDIVGYIKYATTSNPQGGYDLGGFGPVSEGMAMWVIGVVAVVAGAMWMGSRS
ncbi:cytochrome bc1 complex diheme cytochrome c subunit [Williamsia sterculiae]|uniref:Cytochrome bc1 complex cytochrome c subunit n=1 Tax=Williamsia sterculiae TaxID=1344003 RepID=A0A1N7H7Q8_9NOCA|nr:cytochrome c [Williamsia sterculiae]SIS20831.1 ubiquinol-cytochrome c reductase cytochrome c subunit [Williamsia sterculiae]